MIKNSKTNMFKLRRYVLNLNFRVGHGLGGFRLECDSKQNLGTHTKSDGRELKGVETTKQKTKSKAPN